MYAATGDDSFRRKVDYIVKVLAECQQRLGGGYLAAFPLARFGKLEASPKDGGVEYYTIHKILGGLLDAAAYCNNPQALAVAAPLSDFFSARIANLPPASLEPLLRTDYAPNPHNELGGMAEALEDLYRMARRQGDPAAARHLQLAAVFRHGWFEQILLSGHDRLDGMHANTHISQAAALARYAQLTGDSIAARAAATSWNWVVRGHSFVNASQGFNEKFRAAGVEVSGTGESALSPLTGETCGTYNMLRLSRLEFERAPSVPIGDYVENALYNHILATISPETGRVVYFTPLRPGDFRTYIDQPYCCLGTGIENAARFNDAIYFHRRNALWVNLYIPSTLDWTEQGLKLRLETRYPESGAIRLTVDSASPVTAEIRLRIPSWLQGKASVKVNGKPFPARPVPGQFLPVARTWNAGDILELDLPLTLRQRKATDDPAMVSFFYGPVLLAAKLGREGMPATDVSANTSNAKLLPLAGPSPHWRNHPAQAPCPPGLHRPSREPQGRNPKAPRLGPSPPVPPPTLRRLLEVPPPPPAQIGPVSLITLPPPTCPRVLVGPPVRSGSSSWFGV